MKFNVGDEAKVIYHEKEYVAELLKNKINSVAYLISKKFEKSEKKDIRIAIYLDRSPYIIYSIFSILKLGYTYIPISKDTPKERIKYIINDSDVDAVITEQQNDYLFDILKIHIDNAVYSGDINYQDINEYETAYIIYTSGTTGYPKGVKISYGALDNFIKGLTEKVTFSNLDRIVAIADIAFDISIVEILVSLVKGLTVVLADEKEMRNPRLLGKLIKRNCVTIIQMTPSRLLLLQAVDPLFTSLSCVRKILVGGEQFPLKLLKNLQNNTTAKIFNLYGPTEATVWVSISELTNSKLVNIGKPIKNTEIYIVDEDTKLLPNGENGEIVIAGKNLSSGYVNNKTLTTEKFVTGDFERKKILYKTGDIGRYNEDGTLEYLCRNDNQIKYNGYRIELEEIENVIDGLEGIEKSIVIYDQNTLIALFTSLKEVDINRLRNYLANRVPAYMIPSAFFKISQFVYSINGKIDRKETYKIFKNTDR